jgi:two-component system LytT family response regulator
MPEPLKALIVDDEFQSRNLLSKLLMGHPDQIQIVAQASNQEEALISIGEFQPDLVFLDIMLNDGTGFDLLNKLEQISFEIVFTTAYDQYALKAFKFNAIDYLLKPIDPDELLSAIIKARHKIETQQRTTPEQLENLYRTIKSPTSLEKKIAIPTSDGFMIQNLDDIIYCQASGNYTQFCFTNKTKVLSSYTLKQYDEMLSEFNFFRAHKSFLINLKHVNQYRKGEGGVVIMSDGMEIEISRRNKEPFIRIFKG